MSNMSYCRFENTVDDLADCYEHINDELNNKAEIRARERLISICKDIAAEFEEEDYGDEV